MMLSFDPLLVRVSLVVCLAVLLNSPIAVGQRYADKEFSSVNGDPINIRHSTSMLASSGHYLTVGNTYSSGEGANILLVKRTPDGNIVWEREYDGPDHMNDYGVDVAEDGNGAFLVVGSSFRSNSGSYDIVVLKFDPSGQLLWEYFHDGTAHGKDVPCGVAVEANQVVVAGATKNSSTMTDMLTLKLEPDGTHIWTETYDQSQLDDAAVQVDVSSSTGKITVVGGSEGQTNLYDMVTLKYDPSGGLLDEHRSDYNAGVDEPTAFDEDGAGNVVISGYYFPGSGDAEMSLFSLDDTLGVNLLVAVRVIDASLEVPALGVRAAIQPLDQLGVVLFDVPAPVEVDSNADAAIGGSKHCLQ